jgi:hypothetical protein
MMNVVVVRVGGKKFTSVGCAKKSKQPKVRTFCSTLFHLTTKPTPFGSKNTSSKSIGR